MRANDTGITNILNAIKNQWGYLEIDGTDSKVLTLESSTISTNTLTLVYILNYSDLVGETLESSSLSTTVGAATLDSSELYTDISKLDLEKYRFTYTITLIR